MADVLAPFQGVQLMAHHRALAQFLDEQIFSLLACVSQEYTGVCDCDREAVYSAQ